MRAFKRWLDRSLTAQAVLLFLLCLGLSALLRRDDHPVLWVIQAVIYAGIAIAFVAARRRRTSRAAGTDADGVAELNRKIRHREVPRDPEERATMRRLVAEQLGQIERGRRWLPYWLGFMGLVALGLVVLGAFTDSLTFPIVFAVATAGFCYGVLWTHRRALRLLCDMRSALQNQNERVA
ncbi:hypothetical protein ACFYRY_29240 [Streptomyces sp. NPDC005263]|uniref:hypothetical protein n=1 Tax=Streptomyces sp. NPDC005263 TaxID=3364711 RepID=UPI0036CD2C48